MQLGYWALARRAAQLAGELPAPLLEALAQRIAACAPTDWQYTRFQILESVPQPQFRALVGEFLEVWQKQSPELAPQSVALALHTAGISARRYRQEQNIELVWTGPDTIQVPLRHTEPALRQVIDQAQTSLLVVSFAVYKIPTITRALVRAAERSVAIRICVEAPDPEGTKIAYDTIAALGHDVSRRAAMYIWPKDKRPVDAYGKTGSLHVKCAVADEQLLFISSANLTDYAMNLNMELGVLIQGGQLPGKVAEHFAKLIEKGVFRRVEAA